MKIQVEDIYSYSNDNGKGVSGRVNFLMDYEPSADIRVWVTIEHDLEAPLREIEERLISAAKEKLRQAIE